MRHAQRTGFTCRFDSEFVSFARDDGSGEIRSTVRDKVTGSTYVVSSKYLFGCDGARSQIMRQLQIPLIKRPGQGIALNVLVKVDLSASMKHRVGNLHWVMQPDREYPAFGWAANVRMVKPWTEFVWVSFLKIINLRFCRWMFILLPFPGSVLDFEPTRAEYLSRVREMIDDDSIPAEILDVSRWNINEIIAERYSDGNMHVPHTTCYPPTQPH